MNVSYSLLEKMFGYQMIPEVLQRKMGAALKRTEAELVLVPELALDLESAPGLELVVNPV